MEIVVRAAVIYFFLWIVIRALGRATLGELSSFQLVLYVAMGDLVQQGVTQQDYSVTGAVLAIATLAVLTSGIGYLNRRWRRAQPITHGTPVCLAREGEVDLNALAAEQLSIDDFFAAAREHGIRRMADVDYAVLEADGKISFFTAEKA
jgi:uncharacterized membrane protein YcaP (DUF421 family)